MGGGARGGRLVGGGGGGSWGVGGGDAYRTYATVLSDNVVNLHNKL